MTVLQLSHLPISPSPHAWQASAGGLTVLQLCLTLAFVLELLLKSLFLPWRRFIRSPRNRSDAAARRLAALLPTSSFFLHISVFD